MILAAFERYRSIDFIYTRVKVDSDPFAFSDCSISSDVIVVSVIVVSDNFANDSDSLGRHLCLTDLCEDLESLVLSAKMLSVDESSIVYMSACEQRKNLYGTARVQKLRIL